MILQFENKNIRGFRAQLKNNTPEVLDSVKAHYLDKAAALHLILKSKREAVLGEMTFYQFKKYQDFHQYADTLLPAQLDTITVRKKTRRLIEECRDLSVRIENAYNLLECTRDEIELREVA